MTRLDLIMASLAEAAKTATCVERERCALIAEDVGKPYPKPVGEWIRPEWAEEIAARIRSGK